MSFVPRLLGNLLLPAIVLSFVVACGGKANAEPEPPTIHYGEDICEFCNMIISEERFAAGYITQDGQERIFDDIGDMVQAHLKNQAEVTAIFVHDYEHHTWIRAETAYFARSDNLSTPMLSGLAAFPTADKAKDFAAGLGGEVFTFNELLTYYRENPPAPFSANIADDSAGGP